MAAQKFTNFDILNADMTAVVTEANKIVSNEVKEK